MVDSNLSNFQENVEEQRVYTMLETMLSSNNTARKEAEKLFLLLTTSNSTRMVLVLSKVLSLSTNSSSSNSIRLLTCTILNNIFKLTNDFYSSISLQDLSSVLKQVQVNILSSFSSEKNSLIKENIADLIVSVAEHLFDRDSEEVWSDVINLIITNLKVHNNNINTGNEYDTTELEASMYLISRVYILFHDELKSHLDVFINTFTNIYKSNILSLKVKANETIIEMISILDKKKKKKIKEFFPSVLLTTMECLNNVKTQEVNLKRCLLSLGDSVNIIPTLISQSFSDIMVLVNKIFENEIVDNSVKEIAFDLLITIVEKKPKLLRGDSQKLKEILTLLITYALNSVEDTIDSDWVHPTKLSYSEDKLISEEELNSSLSFIKRLYDSVGFTTVMSEFSPIMLELVDFHKTQLNKNKRLWKSQYVGFMALSDIVEEVDEISLIENIIPHVVEHLNNPNPKVVYSCLVVITEISDNLQPLFQNNYFTVILPQLTKMVNSDNLRIQLQTLESLQAFVEHCHSESIFNNEKNTYLKDIMETLYLLFIREDIPIILREAIINLYTEITTVVAEQILPYAETLLSAFLKLLGNIYSNHSYRSLLNSTIEYITILGPKANDVYEKFIPDITKCLLEIQGSLSKITDPVFDSLKVAWNEVIPIIATKYPHLIIDIFNSTIVLLEKTPAIYIEEQNKLKEVKLESLIGQGNNNEKGNVNTSETADISGLIEILNKIIEKSGSLLLNQFENIEIVVNPLLKFEYNSDIRSEAANTLLEMTNVLVDTYLTNTNNSNIDKSQIITVENKIKHYISTLILVLEGEGDYKAMASQLDNIGSIIEKVNYVFLSKEELLQLSHRVILMFEKVERFRLVIIEKDKQVMEELKNEKLNDDKLDFSDDEGEDAEEDEEYSQGVVDELDEIQDILVCIADFFGSIFKTHKEFSLPLVEKLHTEIIPKYLNSSITNNNNNNNNSSSNSGFSKKVALYLVDDIVEYLGEQLVPSIWNELVQIIHSGLNDKDHDVRQAAFYGVGEVAKNSIDFSKFSEYFLEATVLSIKNFPKDTKNEDDWGHSVDNMVVACCKIIQTQIAKNNFFNLSSWVKIYVEFSPISYDETEAFAKNHLFIDLTKTHSEVMFGENFQNLHFIVIVFLKLYKSKLVFEGYDKEIITFIKNVYSSEQYKECIVYLEKTISSNTVLVDKLREILN